MYKNMYYFLENKLLLINFYKKKAGLYLNYSRNYHTLMIH